MQLCYGRIDTNCFYADFDCFGSTGAQFFRGKSIKSVGEGCDSTTSNPDHKYHHQLLEKARQSVLLALCRCQIVLCSTTEIRQQSILIPSLRYSPFLVEQAQGRKREILTYPPLPFYLLSCQPLWATCSFQQRDGRGLGFSEVRLRLFILSTSSQDFALRILSQKIAPPISQTALIDSKINTNSFRSLRLLSASH